MEVGLIDHWLLNDLRFVLNALLEVPDLGVPILVVERPGALAPLMTRHLVHSIHPSIFIQKFPQSPLLEVEFSRIMVETVMRVVYAGEVGVM